MTTRELIEAVHEPERIKVNEWWKGGFMTVKADDYDALRAATLAVLDDLIASVDNREPMPWQSLANARALRERVKG